MLTAVAWFALYTWRKEFIGKKKIELAAEIMEVVCDIQDLLIGARLGRYSSTELKETENWMQSEKLRDPQNTDIYPDRFHFLIAARRLEAGQDKIDKLKNLANKVYLYWDKELFRLFYELHKYTVDVRNAARKLYYNDDPENQQVLHGIIYSTGTDDQMARNVNYIVEECKLNLEPLYKDQQMVWKKLGQKK
jgi:hypothetical protein